ncbi:hypothetical protein KDA_77080 [Dictyobacter alpinus]|uniref:Uncharacterized protein n=1 Tax=Dictyobacter alpinus TaxID=2014873 RepID=A0A402BLK2_9CHLR|nr:hypothetical protein [Dictyobacter alpinus]GCE32224.1 hypothetical protein KDA_77080 [Dictyobacter alpinus]
MPKKTTRSTTPQGEDQPPQRRHAGRPARTPEEREAAKERRIVRSQKGRLLFQPGDPHALDVQFREARNYRHLIAAKIETIQAISADLSNSLDTASMDIARQEGELKAFLWSKYRDHKHRDHILATFLAMRRARLLGRLEAAHMALELATELLANDDQLFSDLRAAVEQQHQAAAAAGQIGQDHTTFLFRLTGPDEGTVHEEIAAIQADLATAQRQEAALIDNRRIYGDSQVTRQRLAEFNEQIKVLRAAISPATGWYEMYYIEKVQISREARKYLREGKEIPPEIDPIEGVVYGPYLKYRWQEETNGPQYTIQMGRLEESSPQDSQEPMSDPWPHL